MNIAGWHKLRVGFSWHYIGGLLAGFHLLADICAHTDYRLLTFAGWLTLLPTRIDIFLADICFQLWLVNSDIPDLRCLAGCIWWDSIYSNSRRSAKHTHTHAHTRAHARTRNARARARTHTHILSFWVSADSQPAGSRFLTRLAKIKGAATRFAWKTQPAFLETVLAVHTASLREVWTIPAAAPPPPHISSYAGCVHSSTMPCVVCVCVCMRARARYVPVYVCVCACVRTVRLCVCVCACVCVFCVCVCVCVDRHVYVCTNVFFVKLYSAVTRVREFCFIRLRKRRSLQTVYYLFNQL